MGELLKRERERRNQTLAEYIGKLHETRLRGSSDYSAYA